MKKTAEELKSKIIQQLRFHRISELDEDKTAFFIMNLFEEYRSQASSELPSDEEAGVMAVTISSRVEPKLTAQEESFFIAGFTECIKYLRTSPLLASKDARILELEEEKLPDGWKVYKCTDCQEINVKKDNKEIRVGFCDKCEHPLWND